MGTAVSAMPPRAGQKREQAIQLEDSTGVLRTACSVPSSASGSLDYLPFVFLLDGVGKKNVSISLPFFFAVAMGHTQSRAPGEVKSSPPPENKQAPHPALGEHPRPPRSGDSNQTTAGVRQFPRSPRKRPGKAQARLGANQPPGGPGPKQGPLPHRFGSE